MSDWGYYEQETQHNETTRKLLDAVEPLSKPHTRDYIGII